MVSEILTLHGRTDGTSTTGTFDLQGDLIYGTASSVRIPKGMVAKIWAKRISGKGATEFIIQYTEDVTAPAPVWRDASAEYLSEAGEEILEKRRPLVLRSKNGTEAFQITWSQASAADATIEIEVEITDGE